MTTIGTPSGLLAPFSLVDIFTASANSYYWSDHKGLWPSASGLPLPYQGWLVGQPKFQRYGSTQTDTGTLSVQNLSGNTVQRDVALTFSRNEFIGALVLYRLWRGDAEQSLFSFTGNVTEAEIDENQMDLTVEGFNNYSSVIAPAYNIDVSCGLSFGSVACGSGAPTPCNQSYGSCTSIERFQGVVIQWNASSNPTVTAQLAQPAPAVARNPARAF